jgi:hypothetical protein
MRERITWGSGSVPGRVIVDPGRGVPAWTGRNVNSDPRRARRGWGFAGSPGRGPSLCAAVAPTAPASAIPMESDQSETGPLDPNPAIVQTKADGPKGSARELAVDDGKMKGKKSIAGGGHAVRFEAPGEGWTLTAVRVHGSRYGYPRPPREDFKVFLCDDQFKQIADFAFPYSRFERGDATWVTLKVKPTNVPFFRMPSFQDEACLISSS